MGRPVTDGERQQIIDDLTAGNTVTAVAKTRQRSKSTVAKIAREAGIDVGDAARSRVARAREVREATGQERRAELAAETAGKLAAALERMGQPSYEVVVLPGGKHGPPETAVVEVPAGPRDWRDQASAVRSLQQTLLDLVRYDERGEDDNAAVDRWLAYMAGGG